MHFTESIRTLLGMADTLVGLVQEVPTGFAESWRSDFIADEQWSGDGVTKREMDLKYYIDGERENYISVRVQVFFSELKPKGKEIWLPFKGTFGAGSFSYTGYFTKDWKIDRVVTWGENPYSHLKGMDRLIS